MPEWLASVGMEVHVELNTRSKMFCRCPSAFGGEPNTRTCPVCLGLPGALPVPNREAVEKVLRTALALNCQVPARSVFHRKNYFYPDLPKGYQISQYEETNPIGYKGWLEIPAREGGVRRINIRRVHLEEDTGKLIHAPLSLAPACPDEVGEERGVGERDSGGFTGVDYNRSGVPLMEIVTDFPPDISDPDDAKEYLVQLRQILLYLDVSDGKMEEGSMRCEPNISVRSDGSEEYGTKTELKNLNSFRAVQLGIEHEVKRQVAIVESGGTVVQETRGWNEQRLESFPQRTKEFEQDYRYFPDPDLMPMTFDAARVEAARKALPELPQQKCRRYQEELGLGADDAKQLVADRDWAAFFEEAVSLGGEPKAVCNQMISDFAKLLNDAGIPARQSKVTPAHLVDLTTLVSSGRISGKTGKDVLSQAFSSGGLPSEIVNESGQTQVSDSDQILAWCRQAVSENPEPAAKYRTGQVGTMGYLVGQVMKLSGGRANPQIVQQTMREVLEES